MQNARGLRRQQAARFLISDMDAETGAADQHFSARYQVKPYGM